MNLKFETIVQIFRKIIQPNAVIILKSTNEYYRKIISKSGRKMDLLFLLWDTPSKGTVFSPHPRKPTKGNKSWIILDHTDFVCCIDEGLVTIEFFTNTF